MSRTVTLKSECIAKNDCRFLHCTVVVVGKLEKRLEGRKAPFVQDISSIVRAVFASEFGVQEWNLSLPVANGERERG